MVVVSACATDVPATNNDAAPNVPIKVFFATDLIIITPVVFLRFIYSNINVILITGAIVSL